MMFKVPDLVLAQYCENKAFSIQARKLGRINEALLNEIFNEQRYKALPTWARW